MPRIKDWVVQRIYEAQRGTKDVVPTVETHGSPLGYGQEAVLHVRRRLPTRETNRQTNLDRTGGWANVVLGRLRREEEAYSQTIMDKLEAETDYVQRCLDEGMDDDEIGAAFGLALAAASGESGTAGNCGEQSAVACVFLMLRLACPYPVEWYYMEGGDHAFVVINRDAGSNPGKHDTWGKTAVVCDPWYNRCFLASEINSHLPLRMGTPAVDVRLEPGSSALHMITWLMNAYFTHLARETRLASMTDKLGNPQLDKYNEAVRQHKKVIKKLTRGPKPQLRPAQSKVVLRFTGDLTAALAELYSDRNPSKKKRDFVDALMNLNASLELTISLGLFSKSGVEKKAEAIRNHVRGGIANYGSSKGLKPLLQHIDQVLLQRLINTLSLSVKM